MYLDSNGTEINKGDFIVGERGEYIGFVTGFVIQPGGDNTPWLTVLNAYNSPDAYPVNRAEVRFRNGFRIDLWKHLKNNNPECLESFIAENND